MAKSKGKRFAPRIGSKSPNYWLIYTLVFAGVFALTYSYFFFSGKLMIWFSDAKNQHLTSLSFLGIWLRDTFGGLFKNHSLNFATYSFGLGYGGDIVQILHYYVFGDPLNLLSVFVPSAQTYILYSFLIVVRLYLAGLAFSKLCFFFKPDRAKSPVLAGALIYVFGGFALFTASRHPYFINPMIYFPMIVAGVEKIRRKECPVVFILGVFLSAVSNFYFFYMIVIFTVLYVLVKLITTRKELTLKDGFFFILRLGIYAVLGVVMAGVILLPVVLQFLSDPRAGAGMKYDLVYNIVYYKRLLGTILGLGSTNREWTYIGLTGLFLPALYTMFAGRKKRLELKIAFIAMTAFLVIPTVGHMLNGMSYAANRWCWAYGLLGAYIVTDTAEDMFSLSRKDLIKCGVFIAIYAAVCAVLRLSLTEGAEIQIIIALLTLFAILVIGTADKPSISFDKRKAAVILAAAVIGVNFSAYFGMSDIKSNFLNKYDDFSNHKTRFTANEANLLKQHYDNGNFCRYTGAKLTKNSSLLNGNSSTQYYFSLSNPNIFEFFNELDVNISMGQLYYDLDDRAALNTLANVKYFASAYGTVKPDNTVKDKNKKRVPYGFNMNGESWVFNTMGELKRADGVNDLSDYNILNAVTVYTNKDRLPFGYTYDSYIPREKYESLTSLQKQEAMLQGVVLDEKTSDIKEADPSFTGVEIPYTVRAKGQTAAVVDKNTFVTVKKGAKIVLDLKGMENCETYVWFKGVDFKGTNPADLYNDDESIDPNNVYTSEEWEDLPKIRRDKISRKGEEYYEPTKIHFKAIGMSKKQKVAKSVLYNTPRYNWYEGKHDFLINLDYEKDAKKHIVLKFPYAGTYKFDDIKVFCQPMTDYSDQVKALKQDKLQKVDFHYLPESKATNEITGEISLKENKVLLLSIPYSNGWKAYVDGKEAELIRGNTMFSALKLTKGNHKIRLNYDTPWLKVGLLMSAAGVLAFIALIVLRKIYLKKKSSSGALFQH